jgi:hypothetical protein
MLVADEPEYILQLLCVAHETASANHVSFRCWLNVP